MLQEILEFLEVGVRKFNPRNSGISSKSRFFPVKKFWNFFYLVMLRVLEVGPYSPRNQPRVKPRNSGISWLHPWTQSDLICRGSK
jgi:hypothetical protein